MSLPRAMFGGVALVLPFAILQVLQGSLTRQNAPGVVALFGLMWFLAAAFLALLMSIARPAGRVQVAVRVVLAAAIAVMFAALLIDQMPCFLGVPNCD